MVGESGDSGMLAGMKFRALFLAAGIFAVADLHGQANNASIEVPDDVRPIMQAKGDGVQIYTCTKAENGQKWTLKGPDAKLLDSNGKVIGSHSAGPTWKLNDGGEVQGQMVASRPSPDAIPWLLLRAKAGTATGSLGSVTYIRRTETHGGVAPEAGCHVADDLGKNVEVPYTATYTFYLPK